MGSVFSAISSAPQTDASASISSQQDKKPVTGIRAIARNIAADVSMGSAAFGQGSATGTPEQQQAQIDALVGAGYTPAAAADYQERTQQSAERLASMNTGTEYGDVTPKPSSMLGGAGAGAGAGASSSEVPEVPTPGGEPGEAEQKVEAEAKSRKGRASTIQTAAQGLLTEPKTRRRRSLMGGLIS